MLKNPNETIHDIINWIRNYFVKNGPECSAVVGISGGKDSSVVAALCVEALGKDRVFGVLMPNCYQADINDSIKLVEMLGIRSITVNIGDAVEAIHDRLSRVGCEPSEQAIVNLPARIRMSILYAVAQSLPNGGRVANTCNLSEDYVGYSTKFGDSAGDFSPLSNLLVNEVLQIGQELGLPNELVSKIPSDGLCGNLTRIILDSLTPFWTTILPPVSVLTLRPKGALMICTQGTDINWSLCHRSASSKTAS